MYARKRSYAVVGLLVLLLFACTGKESGTQETSVSVSSSEQTESRGFPAEAADVFYFASGDTILYPDMDVTQFPELSVPQSAYFEAPSCAAQGIDKTYIFPDFEITTYPEGDRDKIQYIFLKSDAVRTPEGADLSMDTEQITGIYGAPSEQTGNALVYRRGGMRLMFFYDEDGALTSIEYRSGITERTQ